MFFIFFLNFLFLKVYYSYINKLWSFIMEKSHSLDINELKDIIQHIITQTIKETIKKEMIKFRLELIKYISVLLIVRCIRSINVLLLP